MDCTKTKSDRCSVVVNVCYGGFGLSELAYRRLCERKQIPPEQIEEDVVRRSKWLENSYHPDVERDDEDLVAVVRELGEQANGKHAKLVICENQPCEFWGLSEYDGKEGICINYIKVLRKINNITNDQELDANQQIAQIQNLFKYLKLFPGRPL